MDIVYSHVKIPIAKGKLLPEVFKDFSLVIEKYFKPVEAQALADTKTWEEWAEQQAKIQSEKDEAYTKLRGAISLAWDEVKPIALTARAVAAREEAAEKRQSTCEDHRNP
jgi:hypothetical protein